MYLCAGNAQCERRYIRKGHSSLYYETIEGNGKHSLSDAASPENSGGSIAHLNGEVVGIVYISQVVKI